MILLLKYAYSCFFWNQNQQFKRFFSLVAQEVEQCASISTPSPSHSTITSDASSLLVKNSSTGLSNSRSTSSKRKDRLVCSNCGISGHTIDKCYRFHRFPRLSQHRTSPKVDSTGTNSSNSVASSNSLSSMSADQCKELLAILQSHLTKVKTDSSANTSSSATSSLHVAGICHTLLTFISDFSC